MRVGEMRRERIKKEGKDLANSKENVEESLAYNPVVCIVLHINRQSFSVLSDI